MIIYTKESKLDSVDTELFTVCSVSKNEFENATTMNNLRPPMDILEEKKKKMKKRYVKYLQKKNTNTEWTLYSIGCALASSANLCFVCTDEEYETGYLKVLCEVIGDMYDVEVYDLKEGNKIVKNEKSSFSKKEKKLMKVDDDELSKKKRKEKKSLLKDFNKAIGSEIGDSGKDLLAEQKIRFAIDSLALTMMNQENPVFAYSNDGFVKDINEDNYTGKTKKIVKAIMVIKQDKTLRSVAKDVLSSHNIEYKKSRIEKLSKKDLIALLAELHSRIAHVRSGEEC